MATTALELITNALRTVGVLAQSQPVDAEDQALGFSRLNDLLDSWATESLFAYSTAEYTYTLPSGTASITIGPTGNIVAATPSRIEGGFVRSSGVDYPFRVIDYQQFADIAFKAAPGPFPQVAYYNGAGVLQFYPVPSGGELHIPILLRLSEFATLATSYTLPPGYRKALAYSLAEDLAGDYGRNLAGSVLRTASSARRSIKRANHRVPKLNTPFFGGFDPIILGGPNADAFDGGSP